MINASSKSELESKLKSIDISVPPRGEGRTTGKTQNVFYEIGIAYTLGRETILITQPEADIPFDLRHLDL